MAMPVDTATDKERQETAAVEDTGAGQDVYVKLKSLQKHMEFLDIQVGARVRTGQSVPLGRFVEASVVAPLEGKHISRFRCFFHACERTSSCAIIPTFPKNERVMLTRVCVCGCEYRPRLATKLIHKVERLAAFEHGRCSLALVFVKFLV